MNLTKFVKRLSKNPLNIFLLILVATLLLISAVFVIQRASQKSTPPIREDQIQIKKGDKVVIINESGLIEYRTSSGIFYDNWDSVRVKDFFESIREKARNYLKNTPNKKGSIEITLYVDGKLVTFYVDEGDEEVNDILNSFPDGSNLDDFFSFSNFGQTPTPAGTGTSGTGIATATPGQPTGAPTQSPGGGGGQGGGSGQQTKLDCTLYETLVTGRTVISNTLCRVEQPE